MSESFRLTEKNKSALRVLTILLFLEFVFRRALSGVGGTYIGAIGYVASWLLLIAGALAVGYAATTLFKTATRASHRTLAIFAFLFEIAVVVSSILPAYTIIASYARGIAEIALVGACALILVLRFSQTGIGERRRGRLAIAALALIASAVHAAALAFSSSFNLALPSAVLVYLETVPSYAFFILLGYLLFDTISHIREEGLKRFPFISALIFVTAACMALILSGEGARFVFEILSALDIVNVFPLVVYYCALPVFFLLAFYAFLSSEADEALPLAIALFLFAGFPVTDIRTQLVSLIAFALL